MAKPRQRREDDSSDVNLVPLLNLVLILIPLLLLSVVFTEITVIDVAMPDRTAIGEGTATPNERIEVRVGERGFWIADGARVLPPRAGCPPEPAAPTICAGAGDGIARYDWAALYNALLELKLTPARAETRAVHVVVQGDVPFGILVRAMDTVRWQRAPDGDATTGQRFAAGDALDDSMIVLVAATDDAGRAGRVPLPLFPDVVLASPAR